MPDQTVLPFLWANERELIAVGSLLLCLTVMFLQARRYPRFRVVLLVTVIAFQAIYLVWRIFFTLPLHNGAVAAICGVALVAAELLGASQAIALGIFSVGKKYEPPRVRWDDGVPLPEVDILIPTYNEPIELLAKTLTACRQMDYPNGRMHIYLCDDGGRSEFRALCAKLGVCYLARPEHTFAKAGNLNYALERSNSTFVAVFDADMVPKPEFLRKTIRFFSDPQVGFVQAPQVFYSPDPFQFNLRLRAGIPNEQDFFMREIQEVRARQNAVLHVGTNAVFRRKAVEEIGGIPTESVTEDIATGLLIQAKGYTGVYVNQVLAVGLAADRFSDMIHQRERWCRGNIQVSKKWNVFTLPGLRPKQRLAYLGEQVYWLFGLRKMIYLLCPLLYLIAGVTVLRAAPTRLLMLWLPAFAGVNLLFCSFRHPNRSLFWSHIYEVAMAPFISLAVLAEWLPGRPFSFRVTPKERTRKHTVFSWEMALPHLILFFFTVLGWVLAVGRIWQNPCSGAAMVSVLMNMAWSVYNLLAIIVSVLACIERPHLRTAERISVRAAATVAANGKNPVTCRILDLSETGIRLRCNTRKLHMGAAVRVDLLSYAEKVRATVVRISPGDGGFATVSLRFTELTAEQYAGIVRCLTRWADGYFHPQEPDRWVGIPFWAFGSRRRVKQAVSQ